MTHPIFRNYFNDDAKRLFDNMTAEAIEVSGIDCYYLPRKIDAHDKIFNEIYLSKYKEAFRITVKREKVGGYMPNSFIVGKFGNEFGGAETTFAVSKTRFFEITGDKYPVNGGLLIFTDVKQIFEISDVDVRDPWMSGGYNYYWQMQCMPFNFGKNKEIKEDIFDYLDINTEELMGDFLEDNDIYDMEDDFATADSTCIYADNIRHEVSENYTWSYFMPISADRTDIWADDEYTVDMDAKRINSNKSGAEAMSNKIPSASNNEINKFANKFGTSNPFGFE